MDGFEEKRNLTRSGLYPQIQYPIYVPDTTNQFFGKEMLKRSANDRSNIPVLVAIYLAFVVYSRDSYPSGKPVCRESSPLLRIRI